tara:strand:+ start:462 stop:1214 length:753 start_codon:yes stop_codon:yes gene_type:complete
MINIKRKNGGFTSLYRVKLPNYNKVIKIYDKKAFTRLFRTNLNNYKPFYESLNKIKISPNHKVLSEHIVEIDEIENGRQINKKKLFSDEKKIKKLRDKINLIQKINKSTLKKDLISEVKNYFNYKETPKIIKKNIKNLEKYIKIYPQDKICHGDIHFGNIITTKENLYLLDWDYCLISCTGYEIAMLSYLEKLNQKQIKTLSKIFGVSITEIKHYLPICILLDYLYQSALLKNINEKLLDKIKKFIEDIL